MDTAIGRLPAPGALDLRGLDIPASHLETLLSVDTEGWLEELPLIRKHYASFGDRLPQELHAQLGQLEERLQAARV